MRGSTSVGSSDPLANSHPAYSREVLLMVMDDEPSPTRCGHALKKTEHTCLYF